MFKNMYNAKLPENIVLKNKLVRENKTYFKIVGFPESLFKLELHLECSWAGISGKGLNKIFKKIDKK